MAAAMTPGESDIQFIARMLVMTREGSQITRYDSQRLADLAQFGPGPVPTTMPEERREGGGLLPQHQVYG